MCFGPNNTDDVKFMTKLFQQIEELFPGLHGWCSVYRGQVLASQVIAFHPKVSLLIGVWGGRDTFAMALAHKQIGLGKVIAIDPWEASASAAGQGDADRKWWSEGGEDPNGLKPGHHEAVYNDFMSRIIPLGLQDYIEVVRKRSDDVEPPQAIDLAVVDGNHGPQAINDAKRFVSKVRVGGLCYLDDLDWGIGAVREAENYILSIGFIQLYKMDTGAVYQRIK